MVNIHVKGETAVFLHVKRDPNPLTILLNVIHPLYQLPLYYPPPPLPSPPLYHPPILPPSPFITSPLSPSPFTTPPRITHTLTPPPREHLYNQRILQYHKILSRFEMTLCLCGFHHHDHTGQNSQVVEWDFRSHVTHVYRVYKN